MLLLKTTLTVEEKYRMNKLYSCRDIQEKELEIFKTFDRICKKNGLMYFAIGGTCIGAIRHKGFIPWDDDIDVAMPYEDYIKFRDKANEWLPSHLELLDPRVHRYCKVNFLKIHDKETAYIESSRLNFPDVYTGVFIDVMPIFGLPLMDYNKAARHLTLILKKNEALRFPKKNHAHLLRRVHYVTTMQHRISGNYHFYTDKIESQFGKYAINTSDKIMFGWRQQPLNPKNKTNYQTILDREDFKECIYVNFEDTKIAVPIGYDHYLKMEFGDYMTLPPENQRKSNHDVSIIDLDNSFTKYQKEDLG